MDVLRGRAVCMGDSVSTDIMAPGPYLHGPRDVLRVHSFEAIRPGLHAEAGSKVVIAGRNFGCGSHREEANLVLKDLEIVAILAQSVGRIFLRNAVALGMIALPVPGIAGFASDGDEIEVDVPSARATNLTSKRQIELPRLPEQLQQIIDAGGIIPILKRRLEAVNMVKFGARE